jgi:1-acyl-sn-glycerol-3-phosphate acyltransferase
MVQLPDVRALEALRAVYEAIRSSKGEDPSDLPDLGFDPGFFEQVCPLLEFLWSRYFRVELSGLEHIPANGPALLVANHSGGIPYDGMLLAYGVRKLHPAHRLPRPLVANFAFRSRLMAPVVARFGGVRASMENATRLLADNQLVSVFPEGLRGVGKLYRERYRLTRFGRGGFMRLAAAAGVPLIPIAIVGAEEIHPVIGKLSGPARLLGLPYIPITPTFPLSASGPAAIAHQVAHSHRRTRRAAAGRWRKPSRTPRGRGKGTQPSRHNDCGDSFGAPVGVLWVAR